MRALFCTAWPTPMLTTTLVSRGTIIGFVEPNSFCRAGTTFSRYFISIRKGILGAVAVTGSSRVLVLLLVELRPALDADAHALAVDEFDARARAALELVAVEQDLAGRDRLLELHAAALRVLLRALLVLPAQVDAL